MSKQSIFIEIETLFDDLVEKAQDTSVFSSVDSAQKILQLFLKLKKPFEQSILEKFASKPPDEVFNIIKQLFQNKNTVPYFQSMISLSFFFWNWARQFEPLLKDEQYEEITLSLIYGAMGYKLFDTYFDESSTRQKDNQHQFSPSHLYLAKYLISQQESILFATFPNSVILKNKLDFYNRLYTNYGLKEIKTHYKSCPVTPDTVTLLGHKSAPLMIYFTMILEHSGFLNRLDDYETMFYQTTASIQIRDDLADAMADLINGTITLATVDFVKTIDYPELIHQPEKLEKAYKKYPRINEVALANLHLTQKMLSKSLDICEKYQDNMFELFISSKLLALAETLARKESA